MSNGFKHILHEDERHRERVSDAEPVVFAKTGPHPITGETVEHLRSFDLFALMQGSAVVGYEIEMYVDGEPFGTHPANTFDEVTEYVYSLVGVWFKEGFHAKVRTGR